MDGEIRNLVLTLPVLPNEERLVDGLIKGCRADPSLLGGLGDYLVLYADSQRWSFDGSWHDLDTIVIQHIDQASVLTQHSGRDGILLGEQWVAVHAIAPVVPFSRFGQVGQIYKGTEDYGRVAGVPVRVRRVWRQTYRGRT